MVPGEITSSSSGRAASHGSTSGSRAFCDQVDAAARELEGPHHPVRHHPEPQAGERGAVQGPACGTRSIPPPSRSRGDAERTAADDLHGRIWPARASRAGKTPRFVVSRKGAATSRSRNTTVAASGVSIAAIAASASRFGEPSAGSRTER